MDPIVAEFQKRMAEQDSVGNSKPKMKKAKRDKVEVAEERLSYAVRHNMPQKHRSYGEFMKEQCATGEFKGMQQADRNAIVAQRWRDKKNNNETETYKTTAKAAIPMIMAAVF